MKIRVGNELRDMHYLYMGLWRFLYNENFHYFPEGALEVCPYLHVPRVKHEPKHTLIELVEATKTMENLGRHLTLLPAVKIIGGLTQWLCRQRTPVQTPNPLI